MSNPLSIPLEALDQGPYHLEGSVPGTILDLESEESIRNVGDVAYDLTAERMNQEVLIRGRVGTSMELECVRSGLFFSTSIEDSAFLRDYSIGDLEGDLDITEDVREAIVILIPLYPVSPEAQSEDFVLPSLPEELTNSGESDDGPNSGPNPWQDLDQFKPNV